MILRVRNTCACPILMTFQKLRTSLMMIWKICHLRILLWNLPPLFCHLHTRLWMCFRLDQNISRLEENNICPPLCLQ